MAGGFRSCRVDKSNRGWVASCQHSLMARKATRAKTFAELAAEPTWSERQASRTGKYAPRPGGLNPAGEFFDPQGVELELQLEDASAEQAQQAVDVGALSYSRAVDVALGLEAARLDGSRSRT